jgi:hypothetical protein
VKNLIFFCIIQTDPMYHQVCMCRRGVSSQDMDTILGCGDFHWFLFSINRKECARSSFAESPIGPAQCSESGRQVRHIWLHRTISQIPCDGAASNWTINICVIDSAYSLRHLNCHKAVAGRKRRKALDCVRGRATGTYLVAMLDALV